MVPAILDKFFIKMPIKLMNIDTNFSLSVFEN